ncbi:hypothetical protein Emed_007363 [Eimeria media]
MAASRAARATESSSFDGQWRISNSSFLSRNLDLPTLSQALQQQPVRTARIRAAPDLQRFPLLQSQAEAFMQSLDRERSAMLRSSQLQSRVVREPCSQEEAPVARSRLRPDLVVSQDPQKRLLWMSETARSYGRAPQLPCHVPAAFYPSCSLFTSSGYAGKRQRAGLSTVLLLLVRFLASPSPPSPLPPFYLGCCAELHHQQGGDAGRQGKPFKEAPPYLLQQQKQQQQQQKQQQQQQQQQQEEGQQEARETAKLQPLLLLSKYLGWRLH